ncbi:urease accessory protein UreE [Marinobacterium zhoushanense]|uniref:Urease accessory protein UreE n=1 Tax=Marinobacterium zhoushanense TaxID=1679163 RepID=A0ABQ1KD19_9GAMM|nr:urease accessory protein UreE [Marinobacterium zhoushanense]GGB92150.1 urease accessory protein UreE [Marinobacterium zhoushanense]
MIRIISKVESDREATASLCLPIDSRIRSRLRVELEDGREAGLFLPRGLILRGGDRLLSECGEVVEVVAAPESVSTIRSADTLLLMRCAYHLGNRHVPLQVEAGLLRYQHDHVLDDMVRGLGAEVVCERAPFEPEAGAYSSEGHGHHHHDHHASHSH